MKHQYVFDTALMDITYRVIQWTFATVYVPLSTAVVFFAAFLMIELKYSKEPVLPPMLVKRKVPMLVGMASFMVSMCNFAVMYNLPTWFQTVMLTTAGEAGVSHVKVLP
jgi:hypothetical protein